MQKQEQEAAHAAELTHGEQQPLHKLKKGKCHQVGMQERVQIGQQFAIEIKWLMLAKQLRNQHILPFFSLEKWMYSGHRFDPQLFY